MLFFSFTFLLFAMSQCIKSIPLSKYHFNILAFGFQQGNEYDGITFSQKWRSCGWKHLMRVMKTSTPDGNYKLKKKNKPLNLYLCGPVI
jgi:hypothetical protein